MIHNEITIHSSSAEYLAFVTAKGNNQDSIEMGYEDENIWSTQKMMEKLYGVDVKTINEHTKNVYADEEFEKEATIRIFRMAQIEGSRLIINALFIFINGREIREVFRNVVFTVFC